MSHFYGIIKGTRLFFRTLWYFIRDRWWRTRLLLSLEWETAYDRAKRGRK